MADMLIATSANFKVNLYLVWHQINPQRCSLDAVRCENATTSTCTYTASQGGTLLGQQTFQPNSVTTVPLPANTTVGILEGLPDLSNVSITYTGPAE